MGQESSVVDFDQTIGIGGITVAFHRTLRIPDDGKVYPLPPSLGRFPIHRVEDYTDRVPGSWLDDGGVFLPMYQREAMWISFDGRYWHPSAVKVAVGMVNALTGDPWNDRLSRGEQDYLVCPDQPWIDGIKSADGEIRQFIAMPLGMGYSVEGQVTGEERFGGLQIGVYNAKKGKFPAQPPRRAVYDDAMCLSASAPLPSSGSEMGLGAGGRIEQKLYPDPYGRETWKTRPDARLFVHIVNSQHYQEITGQRPPDSPVSAATYTEYGYPWFALYDEAKGDVGVSETLTGVKTVSELDAEHGFTGQQDDTSVKVPENQIIVAKPKPQP